MQHSSWKLAYLSMTFLQSLLVSSNALTGEKNDTFFLCFWTSLSEVIWSAGKAPGKLRSVDIRALTSIVKETQVLV